MAALPSATAALHRADPSRHGAQLPIGAAVLIGGAMLGFGAIGISADAGHGGVGRHPPEG